MKKQPHQQPKTHGITKNTYINKDNTNNNMKEFVGLRAGLPKHGTRWARAQNPMLRELGREERTAPTVRLSVRLRGKQPPATKRKRLAD